MDGSKKHARGGLALRVGKEVGDSSGCPTKIKLRPHSYCKNSGYMLYPIVLLDLEILVYFDFCSLVLRSEGDNS